MIGLASFSSLSPAAIPPFYPFEPAPSSVERVGLVSSGVRSRPAACTRAALAVRSSPFPSRGVRSFPFFFSRFAASDFGAQTPEPLPLRRFPLPVRLTGSTLVGYVRSLSPISQRFFLTGWERSRTLVNPCLIVGNGMRLEGAMTRRITLCDYHYRRSKLRIKALADPGEECAACEAEDENSNPSVDARLDFEAGERD